VVEAGPTRRVFDAPSHPYSQGLLDAFPSIRGPRVQLTGIPGFPPDLGAARIGCSFAPRCPKVRPVCHDVAPELYTVHNVQSRCLQHSAQYASAWEVSA
jgi:peptide/nickel transport system ATP-binding protein